MTDLPWLEVDSHMMGLIRFRLAERAGPSRPDTLTVLPLLATNEGEAIQQTNRMIRQV